MRKNILLIHQAFFKPISSIFWDRGINGAGWGNFVESIASSTLTWHDSVHRTLFALHDLDGCHSRNIALWVNIWSVQMVSFVWAKPVATDLLVIRIRWPFAAKPAAYWVMKKWRFLSADARFDLILGLITNIRNVFIFTRVAYITWVGLRLAISLDSCLYCEDVIKPKLIYDVLMRPKIRPKRLSTSN